MSAQGQTATEWAEINGPEKYAVSRLLPLLAWYHDRYDGEVRPTAAKLAKQLRVSERTVWKAIAWLETNRWLAIVRGGGRGIANIYRLNLARRRDDPPLPPAPEPAPSEVEILLAAVHDSGKASWEFKPEGDWNRREVRDWGRRLRLPFEVMLAVVQDVLGNARDGVIRSMRYFIHAMRDAAHGGPPVPAAARGADPPRAPPPEAEGITQRNRRREARDAMRAVGHSLGMLTSTAPVGLAAAGAEALPRGRHWSDRYSEEEIRDLLGPTRAAARRILDD